MHANWTNQGGSMRRTSNGEYGRFVPLSNVNPVTNARPGTSRYTHGNQHYHSPSVTFVNPRHHHDGNHGDHPDQGSYQWSHQPGNNSPFTVEYGVEAAERALGTPLPQFHYNPPTTNVDKNITPGTVTQGFPVTSGQGDEPQNPLPVVTTNEAQAAEAIVPETAPKADVVEGTDSAPVAVVNPETVPQGQTVETPKPKLKNRIPVSRPKSVRANALAPVIPVVKSVPVAIPPAPNMQKNTSRLCGRCTKCKNLQVNMAPPNVTVYPSFSSGQGRTRPQRLNNATVKNFRTSM